MVLSYYYLLTLGLFCWQQYKCNIICVHMVVQNILYFVKCVIYVKVGRNLTQIRDQTIGTTINGTRKTAQFLC